MKFAMPIGCTFTITTEIVSPEVVNVAMACSLAAENCLLPEHFAMNGPKQVISTLSLYCQSQHTGGE